MSGGGALWLTLGLLAFALVTAVMGTLGAWTHHHVDRHRLIVESKKRRLAHQAAKPARTGHSEILG